MPGTERLTTKVDGGANASASSPYVGLGFYTQDKSEFFFGRDGERQVLMGNLRAARLTLLYAESGVGKSSLLRAGVAARLEQIARTNFSHGQPAQIRACTSRGSTSTASRGQWRILACGASVGSS